MAFSIAKYGVFYLFLDFGILYGLKITLSEYGTCDEKTGPKKFLTSQDMIVFISEVDYSDDPDAQFVYFQTMKKQDSVFHYLCLIDMKDQCTETESTSDVCSCTTLTKYVVQIKVSLKASKYMFKTLLRGIVIRSYDNKQIFSKERAIPQISIRPVFFPYDSPRTIVGSRDSTYLYILIQIPVIILTILLPVIYLFSRKRLREKSTSMVLKEEKCIEKTGPAQNCPNTLSMEEITKKSVDTTNLQETIQEDVIIYPMSVEGIERRNLEAQDIVNKETAQESPDTLSIVKNANNLVDTQNLKEEIHEDVIRYPMSEEGIEQHNSDSKCIEKKEPCQGAPNSLSMKENAKQLMDTTNLQETIPEDVIIYTMSVEGIERRNSLSETEEQSSGYCSSVSQGDDGADDSLDEDSFQSPLTFPTCSIKKDKDVEESSKDDADDVSKEVDITDDIIQIGDEDDREEDSYIKNDEASLLHGTHETQLSEGGEADLHKHFDSCKKNPGHTKFVPVNDFNISHLPEGHHDNDLVEYIKATADLTVRVDVKMTSRKRPEFWPNATVPYAFYNMRGSDVMRVGTGIVRFVNKWREKDIKKYNMGTCRCHKCQHSDTPSKYWGKVAISTATQVVFDDLEARHTSCRLFFDRQDSPLVTLDGWMVVSANIEEDGCDLECMTCDVDLLDELEKMMRHWYILWEKVNRKYKKSRDEVKLTFIVSHPHGCPKQISVGHLIHKYVNDNTSTKYTYTTCTCPGSSGAPVYSLEHNNTWYYDRHVHSGVNSEGINFSGTGRLF